MKKIIMFMNHLFDIRTEFIRIETNLFSETLINLEGIALFLASSLDLVVILSLVSMYTLYSFC